VVFHQKKQKNVGEGDDNADKHGDCWIYIAKKADTKLHLAHSIGKRVQETANDLMRTVRKRCEVPTESEKVTFTSDGNDQYIGAILKNFDRETINYGQIIKKREKGRVVGKIRSVVFGEMDDADIDTVYIERYNLTLRLGISRLVRKSLCFSKCKEMLDYHVDVYQCYNNLIRVNSALTIETKKGETNMKRTPCMAEGITDHIWTWKELLMFKLCPSTID
jgi:IS1 family transposase